MIITLRVLFIALLSMKLCSVTSAYGKEPIEFWLQAEDSTIPATTSLGTQYWSTQISLRMLVPASVANQTLAAEYFLNVYGNVSFRFRDAAGKAIDTLYASNTLLAPNAGEMIGLSPGIVDQVSFCLYLSGHRLIVLDKMGGWFYCDLDHPGKIIIEAYYHYREDDQNEMLQEVEKQTYGMLYPYRKTSDEIFKGLGKGRTEITIKSLQMLQP
jgi:hypothetical protein